MQYLDRNWFTDFSGVWWKGAEGENTNSAEQAVRSHRRTSLLENLLACIISCFPDTGFGYGMAMYWTCGPLFALGRFSYGFSEPEDGHCGFCYLKKSIQLCFKTHVRCYYVTGALRSRMLFTVRMLLTAFTSTLLLQSTKSSAYAKARTIWTYTSKWNGFTMSMCGNSLPSRTQCPSTLCK